MVVSFEHRIQDLARSGKVNFLMQDLVSTPLLVPGVGSEYLCILVTNNQVLDQI